MKKRILIVSRKLIAVSVLIFMLLGGWPGLQIGTVTVPPTVGRVHAIVCGFGTDIGGGVCRGFLTTTGSNQTFTSPSDWNNSNNTIECIGAGGSGASTLGSTTTVSTGGGAGAYTAITNFTFATPGTTTATYRIGSGGTAVTRTTAGTTVGNTGGDTWFNSTTTPGSGTDNTKCGAVGGGPGAGGAPTQNGGTGGAGTSSWGQTRRSGGNGGNVGNAAHTSVATGGGGAAGNANVGGNGVNSSGTNAATNGGQANGTGATGGAGQSGATSQTGGNGNPGTEYTSQGSGGGGGAARSVNKNQTATGGTGGARGGGGGAALIGSANSGTTATSGAGADGIIVITYTPETDPPTPNPMTFATAPNNDAAGQISMVSTTGSDAHGPVEYLFTFSACGANGGTGGTSSSYQTSTSYTDTGLQPNQCYGYNVRARDALGNVGTASSDSTTYSSAAVPGTPTLSSPTGTTLNLTNAENGNPSANPTTNFAVQVVTTSPSDASWLNKWVNGSGNPSATAVWLTDAQLDALVLQGLTGSTTYGVKVKARNEDTDETALSAEGQGTTSSGNASPSAPTTLYANERSIGAGSGELSPVLTLGDATPAFSAVYSDTDVGDTANKYEIIVYSNSGCSVQVWDSGAAGTALTSCGQGNRCSDITFGGTALPFDGAQYWWKIRYWDLAGSAGAFSACTDTFTLLGPSNQLRHGAYFFNNGTSRPYSW